MYKEKIRKENPEKAIQLSKDLIDYVLPKQSKIDLSAEVKGKIENINISITKQDGPEHKDNDNIQAPTQSQE